MKTFIREYKTNGFAKLYGKWYDLINNCDIFKSPRKEEFLKVKKSRFNLHLLTRVKGKVKKPIYNIAFDCETIEVEEEGFKKHIAYLICAVFFRGDEVIEKVYFTDREKFLDWLVAKHSKLKRKIRVWAFNLGFDTRASNIFNLTKRGYRSKKPPILSNGAVYFTFYNKTDRPLEFIDLQNFFRGRLADLGRALNFEKGDFDFNKAVNFVKVAKIKLENGEIKTRLIVDENSKDFKDCLKYCFRDTEIVMKGVRALEEFMREHDLGDLRITAASQAFYAFRKKFMNENIYYHDLEEVKRLERESYKGGRVTPFRYGEFKNENKFYKLDINSMYPTIMKNLSMPTELICFIKDYPLKAEQLFNLNKRFFIIADVVIKTEKPKIGLKVGEKIQRLVFGVGEFRTVLTSYDLDLLEEKEVLEVKRVAVYRKSLIFRDYVDFFYNQRLKYKTEGNKPFEKVCKLFLNSLYGKFAQWGIELEAQEVNSPHEFMKIEYMIITKEGAEKKALIHWGGVVYREEQKERDSSIVSIASAITAGARALLWSYIEKTQGHVFYCDTDSLFTDKEGYELLVKAGAVDNKRLGALKLEETAETLAIYNPKDYRFGNVYKCKGIPKKYAKEGQRVYNIKRFKGLKASLTSAMDGVIVENIKYEKSEAKLASWHYEDLAIPFKFIYKNGKNLLTIPNKKIKNINEVIKNMGVIENEGNESNYTQGRSRAMGEV